MKLQKMSELKFSNFGHKQLAQLINSMIDHINELEEKVEKLESVVHIGDLVDSSTEDIIDEVKEDEVKEDEVKEDEFKTPPAPPAPPVKSKNKKKG